MDFLFRKIDISSLVFFRIVFGILGFADVLGNWIGKHWIERSFDAANFQFKYFGFHWVKTLPEPWLSLVFIIGMIAGLGIAFGKWYRWSALIFALVYSYIYFLEKSYYLNHGYLTMVISWWIIFMPLAKHYSLDALAKPATVQTKVSYWPLFLLQASMGIVYFFGGIAKINSDWLLEGQPMRIWLGSKSDMPILGGIYGQEWVAYFMSWSGMLLDLLVVFFLINKRTRIYALIFVIFFHFNNLLLFMIGIFPFLSVTLTLLFFEPDFPRRIWGWLEKRGAIFRRLSDWWNRVFDINPTTNQSQPEFGNWKRKVLKVAIGIYLLLMLALPFRHHLIPGDVAWTEEGHRYSWRMMLRQKQAYGSFTVKNLSTNKVERINIRDHLTKRQKRKMLTHPEMILQFAHYLRDQYSAEYGNEVAVYADIRAKLNGRKYQQYIDPEVDLAKEEFSWWKHKEWVVPLKESSNSTD
jgi:hypothetical protein